MSACFALSNRIRANWFLAFHAMLAATWAAGESHAAPALSARPDLAIARLALDAGCRIRVTVVNNGPGPLPDSVWTLKSPASSGVYLTVDGKGWGGGTIWNFDPARMLQRVGGGATYVSSYVVTGSVSVQATVDHTAQVSEANEANNTAASTLRCATPSTTSGVPAPTVGAASGSAVSIDGESGGASSTGGPQVTAPARGPGGGLLQGQLPPPPQDLPPPPPKDDPSVEPGELVVVSGNMAEARALQKQAQALGLGIKRRNNLPGLGFVVTVLRVPRDVSVGMALANLRQSIPNIWADANHRYLHMGAERRYGQHLIGWNGKPGCGAGLRLGLVDGAIDAAHPLFKGRAIETRGFLATGIPAADASHGTAVAALLVGDSVGLLPGARLYAANVFRARGRASETTAEWVVQALNWLAESHVAIVNLSFGGPRNLLLEAAVERLLAAGVAVVAAGGNGGEEAQPVYPAAQRGVIAVTAVDADLRPWQRANRGDYIAFSAPGVDVWSAAPGRDGVYVSGTSYAVPFVTAALAAERLARPKAKWSALQQQLQKQSRDLGAPGKDAIFGWGLVRASACK